MVEMVLPVVVGFGSESAAHPNAATARAPTSASGTDEPVKGILIADNTRAVPARALWDPAAEAGPTWGVGFDPRDNRAIRRALAWRILSRPPVEFTVPPPSGATAAGSEILARPGEP